MDESKRVVVRVSAATFAEVQAYATARGVQLGEAADALIGTAVKRRNALRKWSAKQPKKSATKEA